jgi:hypothetical protein
MVEPHGLRSSQICLPELPGGFGSGIPDKSNTIELSLTDKKGKPQ